MPAKILLQFDNPDLARIAEVVIEDALGGYSSPTHTISGITKGIDYSMKRETTTR